MRTLKYHLVVWVGDALLVAADRDGVVIGGDAKREALLTTRALIDEWLAAHDPPTEGPPPCS